MNNKTNNLASEVAEFAGVNQEAIIQLTTFAHISQGFTLAFAEVNFALDLPLLVQVLEGHRRCRDVQFVVIRIDDPELEFVLSAIKEKLQAVELDPTKKLVLIVVGLERAIGYVDHGKTPEVIANFNFARDLFPRQLPYPVVFVLPDYALTRLARGAHDLWAWTSASVQIRSGRQRIEQVHEQVFEIGRLFGSDDKPVKQERIDLLQRLLTQYQPTLGKPDAELAPLRLNILDELADAYFSLTDVQTARHFYTEALNLARTIGKEWTQANALFGLGRTSAFFDNYDEALTLYEQALGLYKVVDDPVGEANTLKAIGDVLQFLKQSQEALNRYDEALQLYKTTGNLLGEANTLRAIGDVLQFLDQRQEALNRYDEALQFYKTMGDRLGEANTLTAIGDVLQFLNQRQEALNRYDEALQLYKVTGSRLGEANTLTEIGDVLLQHEDFDQSASHFKTAYGLYCNIGDRYSQARILLTSIAPVLLRQEKTEEAIAAITEAAELAAEIGYEPMQQHAADLLKTLQQQEA